MFGREKYSKGAFEEATNRDQNAEEIAKTEKEQLLEGARWMHYNASKARERGSGGGNVWISESNSVFKEANREAEKAQKITPEGIRAEAKGKLASLLKAGQSEAIELNKQYDILSDRSAKLYREAMEAQEELEKFEEEKLGMPPVDSEIVEE